jgi:predicted transposase/invertase (TIGR01784 family)
MSDIKPVSPSNDLVFRALMGDPANTHVLLDFVSAVLHPIEVVQVTIQNPTALAELLTEREFTVDVLAREPSGRLFQVEMQGWDHAALKQRMLWNWAGIYHKQIDKGENFTDLRPVIAIWLVEDSIFRGRQWRHRFKTIDILGEAELCQDLDIHVFELSKTAELRLSDSADPGPLNGWLRFFTEAEHWNTLPPELHRPALETAMSTLETFRMDKLAHHAYLAREEANRIKRTQHAALKSAEEERDRARAEAEAERRAKETERHAKELALAQAEAEREAKEQAHALADAERARADQMAEELRLLRARFPPS